jgi:tRNA threonylcarbamoyladenosine biosynthesis protein TsaE
MMQNKLKTWQATTTDDLPRIAHELLTAAAPLRLFTLTGEMGAGKTTFVAAIAQALGVTDTTSSPTYTLVNEYVAPDGTTILHLDLYRLKNLDEALNIGIEDILDAPNPYIFIEWAAVVEPLLPNEVAHITITTNSDDSRAITLHL